VQVVGANSKSFNEKILESLCRKDETDAHMALSLKKTKRCKMPKASKQGRLIRIGKK